MGSEVESTGRQQAHGSRVAAFGGVLQDLQRQAQVSLDKAVH